uniref:ATP synthase gamma chain n=2 Tax=Lygus hesperus TaxID=30085 RepID=A0A0A9YX95_LYGHE
MAAKAETKDVAKETTTTDDSTKETKPEVTAEETKKDDDGKEEGDKEEAADESKTEEPKPFKYKDSFNATAEEHENSPYLWIRSKNLLQAVTEDVEKTQAAMKEVFTDKFEVSLPKLKLPLLMHLYVQMNDIEEKRKVMAGSYRPDKWKRPAARPVPDIITQSVVIREEKFEDASPGTLEEALDVLLPHRKVVYKEQLTLKTKDLDETLDQVVKLTNEAIAKDKKFQKPVTIEKPATENIVPMVPNVGYDRNVALDLDKDSKGKITAGVRVQYEKDDAKKVFFVPVSECSHISPEIVKAAEAVAAHLSAEKFDVFDGVKKSKDLYGLKFSMNDVGEIIMSVVLVIDDKFVEEFYDLSDKDNLPKEVTEYFARVSKVKPKPKDASKQNGEEDGADGEVDEEDEAAAAVIEETETVANGEQKDGDKPAVANGTAEGDEKKDEITIMRESAMRPISLEKSPFLNRVNSQIRDHLSRFGPSLKKFFDEKCSSLGINGIYITWHATNNRPSEWNRNVSTGITFVVVRVFPKLSAVSSLICTLI